MRYAPIAFGVLSGVLVIGMIVTLVRSPLFPFRTSDLEWLQNWLTFTVMDYYGVAIPLAAIVVATEGAKAGSVWAAGVLLLGSPVACAYLAWKLTQGSIALQGSGQGYGYF